MPSGGRDCEERWDRSGRRNDSGHGGYVGNDGPVVGRAAVEAAVGTEAAMVVGMAAAMRWLVWRRGRLHGGGRDEAAAAAVSVAGTRRRRWRGIV